MPAGRDPEPSAAALAMGREAEGGLLRADLAGDGLHYFIPDAAVLVVRSRQLFLVEAKGQEMFRAPPFDGHGLPVRQAANYMAAYWLTGLRTQLRVYDPRGFLYKAWLDELEGSGYFDTEGIRRTPRRIYPLTSFQETARPDVADALGG